MRAKPTFTTILPQALRSQPSSQLPLAREESEEEVSELPLEELVTSSVPANLHSAAFVLTVRSLREGRRGTLVMAWLWVLITTFIQWCLIAVIYAYVSFWLKHKFDPKATMNRVMVRLTEAIQNQTSLQRDGDDRFVIAFCRQLPSPYLYAIVAFLYNAYLLGVLSECRTLFLQIMTCPRTRDRQSTAEETDEEIVVLGLLQQDVVMYVVGLIIPELITTLILWDLGVSFIAFSKEVLQMFWRAMILVGITQVDKLIFHSFYSTSKKQWVGRAQVLQARGRCSRIGIAWPGELLKLLLVIAASVLSYLRHRDDFRLRVACWQCARDCHNTCSEAFNYCKGRGFWPFLRQLI